MTAKRAEAVVQAFRGILSACDPSQTLNLERVRESKNPMNLRGFGLPSYFVLLALLGSVTVEARCIDVMDAQLELPYDIVTAKNTGISYRYDLEQELYEVSWSKNGVEGGRYGPFTLTRSCAPAKVAWESRNFLLLGAGCGTFCWYILALPMISSIEDHIEIKRPLAFDESRDLIAHYCDKDLVCVESLLTGEQQRIRTEHECDSASGLCIDEVRITATSLEYKWRYTPDEPALVAPLDVRLHGN